MKTLFKAALLYTILFLSHSAHAEGLTNNQVDNSGICPELGMYVSQGNYTLEITATNGSQSDSVCFGSREGWFMEARPDDTGGNSCNVYILENGQRFKRVIKPYYNQHSRVANVVIDCGNAAVSIVKVGSNYNYRLPCRFRLPRRCTARATSLSAMFGDQFFDVLSGATFNVPGNTIITVLDMQQQVIP